MIHINLIHLVDKATKVDFTNPATNNQLHSLPSLRIVDGRLPESFTGRVLARLEAAELKVRLGDRDDVRIAWLLVLRASEGHPDPFSLAFYQYFSESPETLIPFFSARADLWRRYEVCMDEYLPLRYTKDWRGDLARIELRLISEQNLTKKPAASVPAPKDRKKAA
jgi:hypothetical protein